MSYLKSQSHTLKKCEKIMRLFNEVSSRKPSIATNNSLLQNRRNSAYATTAVSTKGYPKQSNKENQPFNTVNRKQSQSKFKERSRLSQNNCSMVRDRSSSSFISSYKKQSRLEQIMKLKVKPTHQKRKFDNKSLLNTSLNSLASSRSSLNKENDRNAKNRDSRLQKIMNIKIQKPLVHSTLKNYEPRQGQKSVQKPPRESSVSELKECKKRMKKAEQISEKQDRLWKQFEREREIRLKQQKKKQEKKYKDERRMEERFEKLVQKQLKKIEASKEVSYMKESSQGRFGAKPNRTFM